MLWKEKSTGHADSEEMERGYVKEERFPAFFVWIFTLHPDFVYSQSRDMTRRLYFVKFRFYCSLAWKMTRLE